MPARLVRRIVATACAATLSVLLGTASAAPLLAQERLPDLAPETDTGPGAVTFSGRVIGQTGGRPIPSARVELASASRVAVTDSSGAFRFTGLQPGPDVVVASAPGHVPVRVEVELAAGASSAEIVLASASDTAAVAVRDVTFSGRVVDADSREPVTGARVEMLTGRHRAVSDEQGLFLLSDLPRGGNMLRVRMPGYETVAAVIELTPGLPLVEIPLTPNPIMLAALEAVADRYERRRRSVGVASRVIEGERLALSSGASAAWVVKREVGSLTRCPDGSERCIMRRGARIQPRVYVDDVQQLAGIDVLEMYDASDIARLEVYARGALINVYTVGFMESAAKRRIPPQPFTP